MADFKQYGLIIPQELSPKDWRFGGVSGVDKVVLSEDGDYTNYLPEVEYQHAVYFDTMACVIFSGLNCLEIIQKVRGVKVNYSDRATAKWSGTTHKGNSLANVAECIRTDGVILEEEWPFPRMQRTPVFDWDDYYQETSDELKMNGKRWLLDYKIQWEWIPMDRLQDAMQYGPLQVTIRAGTKPRADGLYTDGGSKARNHAVTIVGYKENEYWIIFDHYDKVIKHFVWNYDFKWALQYSIIKKDNLEPMPILELDNDILVQEVEQSGTFGLHLNKKIMLGDPALLDLTWHMRNNGDTAGKVKSLTKLEWDSFQKVDLKNNPI